MHVVNKVHQNIVLLCHQGHALFLKFGERDHCRCQRDVPVVFEFSTRFLNFLRELFILFVSSGFLRFHHRLAGFLRSLLACIGHFTHGILGRLSRLFGQFCDSAAGGTQSFGKRLWRLSWRERVFGHDLSLKGWNVKPSPGQYSTGTGSKMRQRYHAAAVR